MVWQLDDLNDRHKVLRLAVTHWWLLDKLRSVLGDVTRCCMDLAHVEVPNNWNPMVLNSDGRDKETLIIKIHSIE